MSSGEIPLVHPAINWSEWQPLLPTKELDVIPEEAGIYIVSHSSFSGIQYVGHSRTNLRRRIRRLGYEIDSEVMPYTDPHTAAPCLWAILDKYDGSYWVAWASVKTQNSERKEGVISSLSVGNIGAINEPTGLKTAYLASYRFMTRQSPTAQFGQIIPGYWRSSDSGTGETGGRIPNLTNEGVDQLPHNSPIPSWENWDSVLSDNWMGYEWSSHENPRKSFVDNLSTSSGIFRMSKPGSEALHQVGVVDNIRNKVHNELDELSEDMMVSYVETDVGNEVDASALETDLVGAHYLANKVVPQSDVVKRELSKQEVLELSQEYESHLVESKREVTNPQKIRKPVVAFANADGGYLLIGVSDGGKVYGVENSTKCNNPQEVEERLVNIVEGGVEPRSPIEYTQLERIDGKTVLVARVSAVDDIPCSENGRFYQRKGSESRKMNGLDLLEFVKSDSE